jgi:putative acetyltransferase
MLIKLIQTNSDNLDFQTLIVQLDAYLREKDGDDHAFFAQYNKIDKIHHVIVAYDCDLEIGCGAIKYYEKGVTEIKRMYVLPDFRGKGVAKKIVSGLENWARTLGFEKCILETGELQIEAIHLYQKMGYQITANYGPYIGVDASVCMEKYL